MTDTPTNDILHAMPAWFPDELAHAGQEHLDPTYVPTYDAKSQTDPGEDLETLARFGFGPDSTLVDLGAGTGTFALAAVKHGRAVTAVDVSPLMLETIQRKAQAEGVTNLMTVQAGFLSYAHAGEPVDVVYSRHALHHLPDFWKAVALVRIAQMLKPGGILFLRDLVYHVQPGEVEAAMEEWFARAAPTPEVGWTRAELEEHVREEFSPFSWVLEPMLERSGFRIEEVQRAGRLYAAYVCRSVDASGPR
ncbi:MAG: class I SAM-dependent methyltransferase [Thermomicrobiales bacterium]